MAELKPCPFCCGKAVEHYPGRTAYGIECEDCHIGTAYVCLDYYNQAQEAWNSRKSSVNKSELFRVANDLDRLSKSPGYDTVRKSILYKYASRIFDAIGWERWSYD